MIPSSQNEKRFFLAALVLFGLGFLWLLQPVFISVFLAGIFSILFYPAYGFFLKLFRGKRYIASFLVTTLVFLILVLPFALMGTLILNEALEFLSRLEIQKNIEILTSQAFYQNSIEPLLRKIEMRFHIAIDIKALVSRGTSFLVQSLYELSPGVVFNAASFIFSFFIMQTTLFFLFVEGKNVSQVVLDLLPLSPTHEVKLVSVLKNMIHATFYGYLLTALIQGVLAGLGFFIVGLDSFLLFGAMVFLMSLVPLVGAISVWLPVAIWLFYQGKTGSAVFMMIYGFVLISGIDNFLKPLIMKGKANIHVMLIFFSILGGIFLLGPVGVLVGPVITALFLTSVQIYRDEFLDKRLV